MTEENSAETTDAKPVVVIFTSYDDWYSGLDEETRAKLKARGIEIGFIENFRFIGSPEVKLPTARLQHTAQPGRPVRARQRSMQTWSFTPRR